MEDLPVTSALDTRTGVGFGPIRRAEVLGEMAGRRRSWSLDQKLAIVAEAERCENMTALARRHGIRTSMLYTWRRELRYALEAAGVAAGPGPQFVPVVAEAGARPASGQAEVAMEVDIDGAVLRIFRSTEIGVVTAVVQALRSAR
jgi:transposase